MAFLNPETLPDARDAWIGIRNAVLSPKHFSVRQLAAITCAGCQASRGTTISGPQMKACAELFAPCTTPTPKIVSGVLHVLGRKGAITTGITNKTFQPSSAGEYPIVPGSSSIARLVLLAQEPPQLPCASLDH